MKKRKGRSKRALLAAQREFRNIVSKIKNSVGLGTSTNAMDDLIASDPRFIAANRKYTREHANYYGYKR